MKNINQVIIIGKIEKDFEKLVVKRNDKTYMLSYIESKYSKGIDKIPVLIVKNKIKNFKKGDRVQVIGHISSYNLSYSNKLFVFVEAEEIKYTEDNDCNCIFIEGNICSYTKISKDFKTYTSIIRTIYNNEKSYIPVISRGLIGKQIYKTKISQKIKLYGHLQTRLYDDKNIAYELIATLKL